MSIEKTIEAFLERKNRLDDVEREGREATSEESYEKEFTKLREMSASYKTGNVYPSTEGEKPCNTPKNRYKDIVPFDYTRIKLKNIMSNSSNDYINASLIKGAIGGQNYIAAQGPMPKTVNEFWQMIWENGVKVIFMACREYEGDPAKLKCQRYWPNSSAEEMVFGSIKVTLVKEETTQYKEHLIRHLIAKFGDESRPLVQLHYQDWPDRGVPRCIPGILDLIEQFRNFQTLNDDETPPVLVHCSAGCGRTGTILVIDYVLSLLKYGKLAVDFSIFNIIAEMRRQRMAIVQSPEQYSFVHDAVAELFSRQLKMINSHLYGNVEPSGVTHSRPQVNISQNKTMDLKADHKIVESTDMKKPQKPSSKPHLQGLGVTLERSQIQSYSEISTDILGSSDYSLAKPVSSPPELQYAEPFQLSAAKKNEGLGRRPSKSMAEHSLPVAYGVVVKNNCNKDADANESSKKNEYSYADRYQTDKWSLQGIALGKGIESPYASVDEIECQNVRTDATYAEVDTGILRPRFNGDNKGVVPEIPAKRSKTDELSGKHQTPSKDTLVNILGKLQLSRPEPPIKSSSQTFEIAQVIFRDVNISFPNRVGKPRGKRQMKVAHASAIH